MSFVHVALIFHAKEYTMKYVYIVWSSDAESPWIENIFADKVKAESALRYLKETDDGRGFIYWIQEKEVS